MKFTYRKEKLRFQPFFKFGPLQSSATNNNCFSSLQGGKSCIYTPTVVKIAEYLLQTKEKIQSKLIQQARL